MVRESSDQRHPPMSHRLTFTILLSVAVYASAGDLTSTPSKRMNIVLLYADDWRHDTLGCAGNPIVQTPHLDALAREGVRFEKACVTTSICGVSRASMLTGQWMSRHGNQAFAMFKTPWEDTFPGRLRKAGLLGGARGQVAQREVPG